jgi:hypothetical protein
MSTTPDCRASCGCAITATRLPAPTQERPHNGNTPGSNPSQVGICNGGSSRIPNNGPPTTYNRTGRCLIFRAAGLANLVAHPLRLESVATPRSLAIAELVADAQKLLAPNKIERCRLISPASAVPKHGGDPCLAIVPTWIRATSRFALAPANIR